MHVIALLIALRPRVQYGSGIDSHAFIVLDSDSKPSPWGEILDREFEPQTSYP